jgi:RND family efflux transporter MFP subunit
MRDVVTDDGRSEETPARPKKSVWRRLGGFIMGLLVLGAGLGGYVVLKSMRAPVPRKANEAPPLIVETTVAELSAELETIVEASGVVIPAQVVTLSPEVSGRIIWQHPALIPGGRLAAEEPILRVDPRDADLLIQQRRAQVAQARVELAVERGRGQVAAKEWGLMGASEAGSADGRKLARREYQLEAARAATEAARSLLAQAELMRARTELAAPFEAVVTEEWVDLGQVIGPGTRVATLVARDRVYVRASLPVERLNAVRLPGTDGAPGARARVLMDVGEGAPVAREGRVIQLLPDVDPRGAMARLLIEVPLAGEAGGELPLLLGAYVQVRIDGPRLADVVLLPRHALREDDQVWLHQEGRLVIRPVTLAWKQGDTVAISQGLAAGDEVVTSRISTPVGGMAVQLPGAAAAPPPSVDSPDAGGADVHQD